MIALVDYGMGNLLSVRKALEASGGDVEVVGRGSDIRKADAVVLPGVGNFGDGMEHLAKRGFPGEIIRFIESGKPFLGICLGMQMLLEESEEAPGVKGLGVFKGRVTRFPDKGIKVPHMGWNSITLKGRSRYTRGIPDKSYFYFVHSYYSAPEDINTVIARCDYILDFTAVIGRDNVVGVQFHPEKSQNPGLTILKNFVEASSVAN
jgi:glutamine amidotransferase